MDDTDQNIILNEEEEEYKGPSSEKVGNCRYYEAKFPEVDDVVIVEVKSIEQMGAYVALKEYNDIEGMILLSELSRRRIRSINKIIRVGRLEVVVVLRVDKEKGYIDLSKRRVSPEDVAKCEARYQKAKTVHSILRHVADATNQQLESLYIKLGWPLYRKYGHAYDAFKLILNEPNILDEYDATEEEKTNLLKNIGRRMTPQAVKVRADIEVTCFQYEGIDAIKRALSKAAELTTDQGKIKIKLVAPPLYVLVAQSMNKEAGLETLKQAVSVIKEAIESEKGELVVKVAPRVVQDRDEKELKLMMDKLEDMNREKPGDEDTESEEEEEE